MIIRNATPSDAPFLAKCVMAGMHFFDFECEIPENEVLFERLTECERRDDLLYTYRNSRVAEVDGVVVGSLLSYPGDIYKEVRQRTFNELWPELLELDAESEQETVEGEYYLDSIAVLPSFRGRGIGQALVRDSIQRGISLGFNKITLVVDPGMPYLVSLYTSLGFSLAGHCHAFGVDFRKMEYCI
ncbi:MAG: GNAT family N-acetyltransferase [Candidatus Limimorpha sp.]